MALTADHRLAVYGSLAPGRPNAHVLAAIEGRWFEAKVKGVLIEEGWGAEMGYPGMRLDDKGDVITVQVLEAADLPAHWARLDAFEGEGYRRVVTAAETDGRRVEVSIYVLA